MVVGYLRGTRRVRSDPTGAIKWLELAYPLLVVCGALVVGVLLWAGIEFAAPREATEERKQLGAAVLAAAGVVAQPMALGGAGWRLAPVGRGGSG
jgi:hypothetical protein